LKISNFFLIFHPQRQLKTVSSMRRTSDDIQQRYLPSWIMRTWHSFKAPLFPQIWLEKASATMIIKIMI
jgi:hypothetical protein